MNYKINHIQHVTGAVFYTVEGLMLLIFQFKKEQNTALIILHRISHTKLKLLFPESQINSTNADYNK